MKHILSKSTFLYGAQCPKRLYFYKFRRDLLGEISLSQQAIFDRGTSVGELARDLFPGGTDASPDTPFEYQKSVQYTRELIEQGVNIIYEAAFQHNGVLAAVDILVKRNGRWKAYEVKSSTSVKDVNILDASLQYHVITNCGIQLSDLFIVYINTEYVRKKKLVLEELFAIESVKADAIGNESFVKSKITELKAMLKEGKEPETDIGPHCSDPYPCDFIHHCWKHVPEPSVFSISRLRTEKKFELYYDGVMHLEDLPSDFSLTEYQQLQITAHKDGKKKIDVAAVREFASGLSYPLYYMDFETFQSAVPLYVNSRPYQQIPFQYSLHYKKNKKSQPVHREFLADAKGDPRKPFIEQLLEDTSEPGDILTYNMGFEKSILTGLAADFPAYQNDIDERCDRLIDLMTPFRKGFYYTKAMNGSYSIKNVLPALVPELSYEGMEICDGAEASLSFERMIYDQQADTSSIRKHLLEYCALDTMAMVRLLEKLEEI